MGGDSSQSPKRAVPTFGFSPMTGIAGSAKLVGGRQVDDQEVQMPATAEKRRAAAKKPKVAAKRDKAGAADKSRVERTTKLSERVLEQVKDSQEDAIEAVRRFMESVDEALPPHGARASRRQDVIDSALEMSEKLVETQYDFLKNVVHSAGEALGASGKKAPRKAASRKKK
jgi:hypothetical protein